MAKSKKDKVTADDMNLELKNENTEDSLMDEQDSEDNVLLNKDDSVSDELDEADEDMGFMLHKKDYIEDEEEIDVIDRSAYPLFSVVVLCYKNRYYLKRMLDSIFFQNYPNIELIVSDDCSDDFIVEDIEAMIEEKRGDNITSFSVFRNEHNLGTVRHIDKVLKEVSGQYIIFTAADDRFANTNVFSKYAQTFEDNPDSVWIVGKCNILTANFQKSIYITPTKEDIDCFTSGDARRLFSRWSRRGMAIPCCMAFRPQAFDVVGGIDLEYTYLEDWPLELKLVRNGYAPSFLNEVTAFHSAGGVTNSNDAYGIEVRKKFYDDKNLVYTKEVAPYLDLLTPEDRNLLKTYRSEICERAYYLDIEWNQASKIGKLMLMLKNPKHFMWTLDKYYDRFSAYLQKKKILVIVQLLILSAVFITNNASDDFLGPVFRIIGICEFFLAVLLVILMFGGILVGRYIKKKRALRKRLVN